MSRNNKFHYGLKKINQNCWFTSIEKIRYNYILYRYKMLGLFNFFWINWKQPHGQSFGKYKDKICYYCTTANKVFFSFEISRNSIICNNAILFQLVPPGPSLLLTVWISILLEMRISQEFYVRRTRRCPVDLFRKNMKYPIDRQQPIDCIFKLQNHESSSMVKIKRRSFRISYRSITWPLMRKIPVRFRCG